MSANARLHWTVRHRLTAEVRTTVAWLARAARIPPAGHATVILVWAPGDRRRRDVDNAVPTLKPCCDGLVDAGIVGDDTPQWMTKNMPMIVGPPQRGLWLDVEIDTLADTMAIAEQANVDPDRLAWIIHSRTWGSVRKLQDTTNRPIVALDPTVGVQRSIFGRPVYISNSLSITETQGTSTDCSVILLCDMSQVVVAVSRDLEVLISDQYAFNADQTAVKATCRYDIGVPQATAIVLTTGVRP